MDFNRISLNARNSGKEIYKIQHFVDEHTYIWRYYPERSDEVLVSLRDYMQKPNFNLTWRDVGEISALVIEKFIDYENNSD